MVLSPLVSSLDLFLDVHFLGSSGHWLREFGFCPGRLAVVEPPLLWAALGAVVILAVGY